MEPLERTIKSGIYLLRENREDPDQLEKDLGLTTADLEKGIQEIKFSVEEGIVEYKSQILRRIFSTVESLLYDSRNMPQLSGQLKELAMLVYTSVLQHNIASGSIQLKTKSSQQENSEIISEELNPNEIIQEIRERIQTDPSFQERREVKNILLQIKQYRNEMAELNKLKEKIPKEKLPGLAANFKSRFDEINEKIMENYKAITSEEVIKEIQTRESHPLQKYRLTALTTPLWSQVSHFYEIYSTVAFIDKERYQTREHLDRLNRRKNETMTFLRNELLAYRELSDKDEDGLKISRLLCMEIIRILEKQISWRNTKKME